MRNMKRQIAKLLAIATWLLLGSTGNTDPTHGVKEVPLPELGDAESHVLSPHQEEQLGKEFMVRFRAAVPTVDDPILKYYVHRNLQKIAVHVDLKTPTLHSFVIDSEELNAFAAPGGVVGINLGLLLFAEDVHEYSSVVAHELAHLSQRHFARRLEKYREQGMKNLLGFMTSAAIIASGATDAGLATMFGTQALIESETLSYSRSQEREADRIGFNALTKSGFDPDGASRMFERMQVAYRFQDDVPEFLRSHPITENRIADVRNLSQNAPEREYQDSPEYEMMRARAMHRTFETAAEAVAAAKARSSDSVGDRYARSLAFSKAQDHDEAILEMQRIRIELPSNNIIALACLTELLIEAGRNDEAISSLEKELADTPDNAPLSMIYAKALKAAERYDEATDVLTRQSRLRRDDIDVWFHLAETAGLAKRIVDVHRARAEFYVLRGNYHAAVDNLQRAKNLNNGENYRLDVTLDQKILDVSRQAQLADNR